MKPTPLWLLLAGLLVAGCSQTPPTPTPAKTPDARQLLLNSISGDQRGSRNQARTLHAESQTQLAARNFNSAMEKRLEILAIQGKKSSVLSALTSYATQSLAIDDIDKIASSLDATAARKYADQLEQIDAQKPTFPAILESQKASEIELFTKFTKTPQDWQKLIKGLNFTSTEKATLQKLSPDQVKANIAKSYDSLIQWAKQPYSTKKAPTASDPYTQKFSRPPMLELSRFLWAKNKAARVLTIVALRQRADRLDKQKRSWPIPTDPFSTSPLKEKNGAIYSIGPDLKDDGGKPVSNPALVREQDKGDIPAPLF